jgi:hypothetical protein
MTKIDVGVGKEFPVESDEERLEREAREREARGEERDHEREWGCGDYREAREYYRNRYGRHWRRHWRGRHGFFFPNFLWIAAGVALIILAAKAPFWTLALIAIVAFVFMARRNGLISEIVRDIREGWDGSGNEGSGPDSPRGPNTPGSQPASSSASANGATNSASHALTYTNPTGSGEGAGTRS